MFSPKIPQKAVSGQISQPTTLFCLRAREMRQNSLASGIVAFEKFKLSSAALPNLSASTPFETGRFHSQAFGKSVPRRVELLCKDKFDWESTTANPSKTKFVNCKFWPSLFQQAVFGFEKWDKEKRCQKFLTRWREVVWSAFTWILKEIPVIRPHDHVHWWNSFGKCFSVFQAFWGSLNESLRQRPPLPPTPLDSVHQCQVKGETEHPVPLWSWRLLARHRTTRANNKSGESRDNQTTQRHRQ